MRRCFLALGLSVPLFLSVVPGLASADSAPQPASPTAPAAPAKPAKTSDADQIVCVSQPVLNSRIPGPRECHTRKVWAEMAEDARSELRDSETSHPAGEPGGK